jgi:hypothetical protein
MSHHLAIVHPVRVGLVIRDTAIFVIGFGLVVALLLWAAWHLDFGLERTSFRRILAVITIGGFVCFFALMVTLVSIERVTHYSGEASSSLHPPMILSTTALTAYFSIASINAVDVFYRPQESWPLLRDPTVQIITTSLVFLIVAGKAWLLYEILPDVRAWLVHRWPPRNHPAGGS